MYQITKLTSSSQNFILELTSNNIARTPMASITLAKVLAYDLDLPSSDVEDVTNYYRHYCYSNMMSILADINELCPIDVDAVLEYILKFYNYRYSSAYASNLTIAINKDYAIADFFGISKSFDKETLNVICENHFRMTDLAAKFASLINDLVEE